MYFSSNQPAGATAPAPDVADWEHVNSESRRLLQTPDTSALATNAYAPDAADHLTDEDAHNRQYVSDALQAQTISGSIKAQLQCGENNGANNVFLTMKLMVIDSSGPPGIVATLLAITRDTTNEVATTVTNRDFAAAIGSYVCADGDRLVLEVGLGGLPTAAGGVNGHNGGIRFGCNASTGDLPEDDTETALTYRPWIEFTDNLLFKGLQPPRSMHQFRQRRQ